MTATMETLLFMMAVLAAVAVAAKRLNIAPSILLVVAGIGMALVPGLPKVELAPEVVLLVLLPPLIYSAGVAMSWRDFRFNLRPIGLLAFGCVVFTTCAVAAAAHYLLKFDWAVGFLLGAIISPTDVVAPLAIARHLGIPRRIVVVLEGEGLANDATALVLYRFAVAAVVTGTFSLPTAAGEFGADRGRRNDLRPRGRLAQSAPATMVARSARRDHAVADDALSRFLGAGASRRLRRAGDGCLRALRELERAAADPVGHAAARHLLLGPDRLSDRGPDLPGHRPAGAHADRQRPRLLVLRTAGRDGRGDGRSPWSRASSGCFRRPISRAG